MFVARMSFVFSASRPFMTLRKHMNASFVKCHIYCANEVADAVDESLAFACKECHANIH